MYFIDLKRTVDEFICMNERCENLLHMMNFMKNLKTDNLKSSFFVKSFFGCCCNNRLILLYTYVSTRNTHVPYLISGISLPSAFFREVL